MSITRTLIALGLVLAAARADVHVVDPGGGDGDALLKAAIAAADPGDVLLLQPGDYDQDAFAYFIDKGLTILPASPGATITLGPVQIEGVPTGQTVVLRGFEVHSFGAGGSALVVSQASGTVWIEDCHLVGGHSASSFLPGDHAALVSDAQAIFRHCSFTGGAGTDGVSGASQPMSGGEALHVASFATVALHDCTLVGGDQGSDASPFSVGGSALTATYSDVTISGCTLTGGKEAAGNEAQPGTSGSALAVQEHVQVRVLDSVLQAGAVQGAGTQAPAVFDPGTVVQMLDEPARALVLPALAHASDVVPLLLDGEPGDLALVVLASVAGAWPVPTLEGTLALQLGTIGTPLVVGVLPGPDGQLSVPLTLGGLPPGADSTTTFAQGLFLDADGRSLGSASALTWIADGL